MRRTKKRMPRSVPHLARRPGSRHVLPNRKAIHQDGAHALSQTFSARDQHRQAGAVAICMRGPPVIAARASKDEHSCTEKRGEPFSHVFSTGRHNVHVASLLRDTASLHAMFSESPSQSHPPDDVTNCLFVPRARTSAPFSGSATASADVEKVVFRWPFANQSQLSVNADVDCRASPSMGVDYAALGEVPLPAG